jgi:hypothetical protein
MDQTVMFGALGFIFGAMFVHAPAQLKMTLLDGALALMLLLITALILLNPQEESPEERQ